MTSLAQITGAASEQPDAAVTMLDVTIPVYNEETDLAPCVHRLHAHLERYFPYQYTITIADNASTDSTPLVATRLAHELDNVSYRRLEEKGRGRALSSVWSASQAEVLAYMDVDMSTDLNALLPLVAPLISGHSDLAIGSRLSRHSRVVRGTKRELISRCYNLILRSTLFTRFSDAQCGFKAMRAEVARKLLPLVEDTGWFFDTELLVLAERAGLRIHEVPVDWVDDPDSRVDILATAVADLKGVARVGRALATGRLPLAEIRTQLGRNPLQPEHARRAGRTVPPAGALRRDRRGLDTGLPGAVPAGSALDGRAGGQSARPAGDRGGQHRGQPAVDVRHIRQGQSRSSSGTGPGCVRPGPGLDQRLAGGAASDHHPPAPRGGTADPGRREPGGHVLRFVLLRRWVFRQAPGERVRTTAAARSDTRGSSAT